LLVLCTIVWGATFVVVKDALMDVSPLLFNAVRMTLAALLLLALLHRRLWPMSAATLRAGCWLGFWMMLGYEFQTAGLAWTTPSRSAFLTGLSVVLVPLLLAVFWHRRVNRWTLLGVLLALAGLYGLTTGGRGDWRSLNAGDVLTLLCAFAWAFQIIYLTRVTKRHPFLQVVAVEVASCALMMWLAQPIAEPHAFLLPTARLGWAFGITVILATVAAFVIQAWAQQFTPPTHASLIYSLELVFAALTSYLFLHERLGWSGVFGGGLILGGILISELWGSVRQPEAELNEEAG
jgi:drug/metabolite transporter (DMT)-like permease